MAAKSHLFKIRRQCLGVNGVPVVLRCDVHTPRCQVKARNIVGTVSVLYYSQYLYFKIHYCAYFELGSSSSGSQRYQLVAQADAKYRQL